MLRCAVAQLRVGLDRADNLRRAAALIDAAAREGAALVALPFVPVEETLAGKVLLATTHHSFRGSFSAGSAPIFASK